jgi:hypothetical protein
MTAIGAVARANSWWWISDRCRRRPGTPRVPASGDGRPGADRRPAAGGTSSISAGGRQARRARQLQVMVYVGRTQNSEKIGR